MDTFTAMTTYSKIKGLTPPQSADHLHMGEWNFQNINRLKDFWKWVDNNARVYRYLVTFTLRPEAVGQEDKAEEFIKRQAQRTALGFTSFTYARETTKKGVAHWHAVVETTKPLKKNRFDYYMKKFGRVDISKTKGPTTQEALQYISKESEPVVLL